VPEQIKVPEPEQIKVPEPEQELEDLESQN